MGKGIKRFLCICLIIGFIFTSGCNKEPVDENIEPGEDEIIVGFSMATLMEDRWLSDRDIFMAKAKKEGIKVIVNNANNDSDVQYQQVLDMLDQGIDILVIAPNDCNKDERCVEAAKEKGIPVISYDRLVYNGNADVYISFDNYYVGVLMGNSIVGNVSQGNYILINGDANDSNSSVVHEGYMSVLQPYIDKGEINIISETWVDGWTRESAYEFVVDEIGKNNGEIDGIICGNDSLAWGAIDALSEAQIVNQVAVVGQDADLVACRKIVSGKQLMTVYKPIDDLVARTVEICLQLYNHEEISYETTINDGTYEVPCIYIDVKAVTKDNMEDTVIKDGFHLREDIYVDVEDANTRTE